MSRRCNECLFGNSKIVSDEAKADVLATAHTEGGFFQCHKATIGGLEGGCCKGYFDRTEDGIVIAVKRMGYPIQWIDPNSLEEVNDLTRVSHALADKAEDFQAVIDGSRVPWREL
jgi:hypothetical protein